jgi:uncharacterized protein
VRAHAHARAYVFKLTEISVTLKKFSKTLSNMSNKISAKRAAPTSAPITGRRIQTRRSGVHGKGVFAVTDFAQGETIIEYVGEIISWKEALRRHPHDPQDPNHTFYFHIDETHVIDAKHGGNSSRWINHSCKPNCEPDEIDGRIFIKARRNILAGEELSYDYGLVIDAPLTDKLKAEYPCWCGAKKCRGTLLSSSTELSGNEGKGGKSGKKKKSGKR